MSLHDYPKAARAAFIAVPIYLTPVNPLLAAAAALVSALAWVWLLRR